MPLTEITAENYLVEEHERGFYHCRLERKLFSSVDGSRLSRPFIQKFDVKGFDRLYRTLVESGYDVDILHDPTAQAKADRADKVKADKGGKGKTEKKEE